MEAMQPPGSFKIRGVGLACQEYSRRGAARFISSSGGNAGIAVAYAGRHLGVPVTVVVPQTTSERARTLLRQENADVIVSGASWQEANALAQSMVGERDAFLHPFDDPLLWRGHSSMDPVPALIGFLRNKRMLLILDSCEHVIETAAALVERIFGEAPQAHILATSRESLRVEGEHVHRLGWTSGATRKFRFPSARVRLRN